jgi:hypothetical protein
MSDRKTKRQFGAFYRKRKNESNKEKEKLPRSMLKFVKFDEGDPTPSTSVLQNSFQRVRTKWKVKNQMTSLKVV